MKSILWIALSLGCVLPSLGCGSNDSPVVSNSAQGVAQSIAALGESCPSGAVNVLAARSMVDFGSTVEESCAGSADAHFIKASSSEAEHALVTLNGSGQPNQQIAPMARPLAAAAVCSTQVGSPSMAASIAVGLDAVTLTSRTENAQGSGANGCTLAYSSNAGSPKVIPAATASCPNCQYTINPGDWRDVLRILYAGVHKDGRKDCNSPERQYLANHWQSIFESTCGSGDSCNVATSINVRSHGTIRTPGLQHLFRPGDFSDTTETFLSTLGLPAVSDNPFCNGWQATFAATGDADYVDKDPVRRPCNYVLSGTTGDGDQVCNLDGSLGLVLPIVVPQASATTTWAQDTANVYPSTLCTGYAYEPVESGTICPNGLAPDLGACMLPFVSNPDGTHNYNCLTAAKLGNDHSTVDQRVYNMQLRAPDGTIRHDERGRPMLGAFYRMRTFASGHIFFSENPHVSCISPTADGQLGCLSGVVPCAMGLRSYAEINHTTPAGTALPVVKVAGVAPNAESLQNLVNAPSQAYPMTHRIYVNSVLGIASFSGAEERLGACWTRPSLARSAAMQNDFVELPGGPSCEDFDETACGGSPSYVDACAANVPSCSVDKSKELLITDLSVVEDPIRAANDAQYAGDPRQGAFSIKHMFESISPTVAEASAHYEDFIADFFGRAVDLQGQTSTPTDVVPLLPRDAAGKVDLARAPFRLLAVASRIDLRDLARSSAGEVRFVYGATNPDGSIYSAGLPPGDQGSFTLIFEFTLPAQTEADVSAWAQDFHALGAIARPSGYSASTSYSSALEPYNNALQTLTDRVTTRGVISSRPNGSALATVRSRAPGGEMRQFILCPTSVPSPAPGGCTVRLQGPQIDKTYAIGRLIANPLSRTPHSNTNIGNLGPWINAHAEAVLRSDYEFADTCPSDEGSPTCIERGNYSDFGKFWDAPGATNDLRHAFAINTCNGCHESETGIHQFQIAMRLQGAPSVLSPLLTGTAKALAGSGSSEPGTVDPTPRHFNELERRVADLRNIVCPLDCVATSLTEGGHSVH